VGRCGNKERKTSRTKIVETPIPQPTTAPEPTTPAPITIELDGTWILALDVTFAENTAGNWERAEACALPSVVNGFRFKSGKSGLTRLALTCSKRTAETEFKIVKELESGFGGGADVPWVEPYANYHPTSYANGFVFQTWTGRNGNSYRGNWKLTFHEQPEYLFLPKGVREVKTTRVTCPEGQALCGMTTMLDSKTQSNLGRLFYL